MAFTEQPHQLRFIRFIHRKDLKREIPAFVPLHEPVNGDERRGPHAPCHSILGEYSEEILMMVVIICEMANVREIIATDKS